MGQDEIGTPLVNGSGELARLFRLRRLWTLEFRQPMDLQNYPFDFQCLGMRLRTEGAEVFGKYFQFDLHHPRESPGGKGRHLIGRDADYVDDMRLEAIFALSGDDLAEQGKERPTPHEYAVLLFVSRARRPRGAGNRRAATPRRGRGYSAEAGRGDAAAGIPRRRVAATPRRGRGYSAAAAAAAARRDDAAAATGLSFRAANGVRPQAYHSTFFNAIMPVSFINFLSIMVYWVPPCEVADRGSVTLTLFLTAVSFKSYMSDRLPAVPYLTSVEYFLVECMGLLLFQGILVIMAGWYCVGGNSERGNSARGFPHNTGSHKAFKYFRRVDIPPRVAATPRRG